MDGILVGQLITGILALVTAVSVAVFGLRGQRSQAQANVQTATLAQQGIAATEHAKLEVINIQELWGRVERVEARSDARINKLEEALATSEQSKDALVIENAKLNATVSFQSAQIAQLQAHMTRHEQVQKERDSFYTQLQIAQSQIKELQRQVASLTREISLYKNPNLINVQKDDA